MLRRSHPQPPQRKVTQYEFFIYLQLVIYSLGRTNYFFFKWANPGFFFFYFREPVDELRQYFPYLNFYRRFAVEAEQRRRQHPPCLVDHFQASYQLFSGPSPAPNGGHLRGLALQAERRQQQQQGQVNAGPADGRPRSNRLPRR